MTWQKITLETPILARRRRGRPVHGWLAVDKPSGLTSTQVLSRVKRALDAEKAGHGGTLDPIATGVLPVALGAATKTVSYAMNLLKTYEFELIWGTATETDDSEGHIIETSLARPDKERILSALPALTGDVEQVPPKYSAIKVGGQRAYSRARRNQIVELEPRHVQVKRFELIDSADADHSTFRVVCGKGTYVRALARDLGKMLGTCAHICRLRRTQYGPFFAERSISLDKLEVLGHSAADSEHLLPVSTVLDDIPALAVTEQEARRMCHGQPIALLPVAQRTSATGLLQGATVKALCGNNLIAVAKIGGGLLHPVKVLNH